MAESPAMALKKSADEDRGMAGDAELGVAADADVAEPLEAAAAAAATAAAGLRPRPEGRGTLDRSSLGILPLALTI